MSNPIISSPSSFANMSRAQLDLGAQAATTSGFDPYDILYGPPSNTRSPSLGPRTSTPAGSGLSQGSFSPSDISIPPTPSPTLRRRGRQPTSLLNLAREQVRARGINPMEFMARPLREAGRRGGVGPIVVPPFTASPSPLPSSIDFSQARSTISSRGRRRQRRQQRQGPARSSAPAGLGRGRGDDDDDDDDTDISANSSYRRRERQQELLRELQRMQQDNVERSRGRQIAGVTHTNTITTTYKDGGTPTVSRTSSRVSN